ncbi:mucin-19-like isoform X13 [Erpetoichthys calabaricus]|uniref:mucin-19-like isoform X13 n=1 Tax=Erpetoichthys calabaricus TaxID=27687 RepID=UPI0022348D08|nr:mucin-19-like isoform X13 [Erpetoichthys calabaricus]
MGLPLKVVIFGLSIVIGASSFSGFSGEIGSGSGGSGFDSGSGEYGVNPTAPPTISPDDMPDVPSDVDECSVFGTGSIKTFNSTLYYLQSTCTFVLSRFDSASSNAEFDIIIKRDMNGTFTKIQVTIDKTETVIENGNIMVDGERVSLPYDHKSIHVNNFGIYKRIESRRGFLSVFWDTNDDEVDKVWVQLRKDYRGKTAGLCGKYGVDDSDLQQLIEDNKIATEESCETETSESNCDETTTMCQNAISYNFFPCLPYDLIWPYMELCGQDTCHCANPAKCACAIFEEIVRQCPSDGIATLSPTWRDSQHCDEPSCPGNMIYSEAGPAVPKTCSNPTFSDDSQISTCQCPYGTVLDDLSGKNKCVMKKQCPCAFDGNIYESGEVRESLCQSCVCKGGQWDCENNDCVSRCTIEGGSAIKTFDGKTYSVYRNCKYITAVGEDWTVSITLRKCKNGICLTQVELSLQSEIFTFFNETVSNGTTVITDSYKSDSVVIFWQLSTYVQVQTSFGLKMQVQMAPNMQLYITLPVEAKGSTKGLCGNYNDKIIDEFISSYGILEHSADNFAESWAIGPCEVIPPPVCIRSENEQYGKEKCAQIRDPNGVFAPCHSLVEYKNYVKQCEINTCLCERAQTCLCDALGNYAKACAAQGFIVTGWRGDDCVEECPATQHFLHNAFACNRTCRSLAGNDYACDLEDVPVDGCGCLEGLYMNENGLCISKEKCPCYYEQGMVYPGSTEIKGQNCNCTDGVLHCETPESCSKNEIYVTCFNPSTPLSVKTCSSLSLPTVGRTQCESGCYCQEGFYYDHNGVCVSVDDCSCIFEDKIYNAGESVDNDCNKCTCSQGRWECTLEDCPGKCQVYGDGHYQTFDLKWYSYDGNCEYSLVEDYCGKDTGNFRITVESVPCCEEALTCSRAVTIELHDTEIELSDSKLTEKRIGSCRDNMIEYSAHTVGLYIIITTSSGITLIWDKHTRLTVILDPIWKGQVCGLCGNFDSDPTNDFETRGKSLVTNVVEFGNSWKFDPSCGNIVNQSFPCEKHWYCSAWAQRRCSIIKDTVFQSCHSKVDPQPYYDVCVQESCVCEMEGRFLGFCTAVAAYAEACNEAEVCIKWRTPDLCPVYCDYYNDPGTCSWHYEPCGTPAIKTCSNNEVGNKYAAKLEGCYAKCPDNIPYLDENTMTCSTLDNCTCFHNGIIQPGETITNECNQTCICTNGVLSCTDPSPPIQPNPMQPEIPQPPTDPQQSPTQPETPQPPADPQQSPTQPETPQPPTDPQQSPTQPETPQPPTDPQQSPTQPETPQPPTGPQQSPTQPETPQPPTGPQQSPTQPETPQPPTDPQQSPTQPETPQPPTGPQQSPTQPETPQPPTGPQQSPTQPETPQPPTDPQQSPTQPETPQPPTGPQQSPTQPETPQPPTDPQQSPTQPETPQPPTDPQQSPTQPETPQPPTDPQQSPTQPETPQPPTDPQQSPTQPETPQPPTDPQQSPTQPETPQPPTGPQQSPTQPETPQPPAGPQQSPTQPETPQPPTGPQQSPTQPETPQPPTGPQQSPTQPETPQPPAGPQQSPTQPETPQPPAGPQQSPTQPETPQPPAGPQQSPTQPETPQPPTGPQQSPTQPETPQPPAGPQQSPTQPETPQPPAGPQQSPTQPETPQPPADPQQSPTQPETPQPPAGPQQSPTQPETPQPPAGPQQSPTQPETPQPPTISQTTTGLACSGTWTDWVNKNSPTLANGGDHETTASLCSPGSKVENIQCEPVNPNQFMQNVICNKESGLICHNDDQSLKNGIQMCADYQIRVCCSNTVPTNTPPPTPTKIVTPSPPCICEGNQENDTFACGETWIDGCSNYTCIGHNLIQKIPFNCPVIPMPKCDNGLDPDIISDGCCTTYDCGCKCEVFGDPHYLTFSGVQYAFLSDCTYILVQEKKPVYGFSVAVDNYYCIPGLKASCAKGMFITYLNNSLSLTITNGNILSILNGNVVKPPIYQSGIQMQTTTTVVTVYIEDIRTYLSLSIYNTINIQVPRQFFGGNTQGQCGECGGHSCIRRDGTQEPDTCCDKTAYEWIINDPTKPSCTSAPKHVPCQAQSTSIPPTTVTKQKTTTLPPKTSTKSKQSTRASHKTTKTMATTKQTTRAPHKTTVTTPTIKQTTRAPHTTTVTMPTTTLPPQTTPEAPIIPICDILNNKIFDECRAQVDLTVYEDACIFDHNLVNSSQIDCSSISRAAGRCKEVNICVNWRHLANGSCDIPCDKGMVFDECQTNSDDYCQGGMQYSGGSLAMMTAGCFCPEGLMLADKFKTVCVSECPSCKGPLGEPKMVGDIWISNCHICTCNNLTLTEDCQPIKCPPVPTCSDGEIFVPQYSSSGCCTIGNCVEQTCVTQVSNVTVQYNGCTGVVQVAECQGQCQSGASFSADSGQMTQSCTCCLPYDTEERTVQLNCPGSSGSNYNYSYVNSCTCSPCSNN